jgi:hypothetical protein
MTIHSTAKSKVYIGTNDRATTETEFEAETWTEIKETEDLGEFGASREEITFSGVGDGFVRRRAGVTDSGSMELICARDPFDPGQQKARDAVKDELPYNFKVVLADKSTPTGTPTTYYFSAVVLTARNNLGTVNDITKITFTIGIDGEILEIEATT